MKPDGRTRPRTLEVTRERRAAEANVRAGLEVALDAVDRRLEPFGSHDPAAGYDEGYHTALAEIREDIQAALAAL